MSCNELLVAQHARICDQAMWRCGKAEGARANGREVVGLVGMLVQP